eukprot:Seg199.15 transcript_id=Seg199.15/GoldUCD/mRNA.D3Y31 product="hypothetical protein" pseudo=true protein_id=Seg199.15/GoldUCD/D3Y31
MSRVPPSEVRNTIERINQLAAEGQRLLSSLNTEEGRNSARPTRPTSTTQTATSAHNEQGQSRSITESIRTLFPTFRENGPDQARR